MRSIWQSGIVGALVLAVAAPTPAVAQDDGTSEIVVTGFRRLNPDDDEDEKLKLLGSGPPAPVQTLRRTADFAVQQVIVVSDATNEDEAKAEIVAMTRKAIDLSASAGTLLATGELVVEPLTPDNYKDLKVEDDDDEFDGELVKFLVKVPLAPGIDARTVLARIDAFLKAVPPVGRAQMKAYSELTLSVVNPEQYRGAIIDLVAKDTAATTALSNSNFGTRVQSPRRRPTIHRMISCIASSRRRMWS